MSDALFFGDVQIVGHDPRHLLVHPVSKEQEPDNALVLLSLELWLVADHQLPDVEPGLSHKHTGAKQVLLGAPWGQQGHDHGAHLAPRVQRPALLEQPRTVSHETVNGVEHGQPWAGRQLGVGQLGPDIRWEVHL